jgi:hypothetical protein
VAFGVALIDCAGGRDRASSTQAVAGKIDAMGVVDKAVEDGAGIEPALAKAGVGSPMTACHLSTGIWLVRMVERRP